MKTKAASLFGTILLLAMATPVFAHHSMSMYDGHNQTTLKAVVTQFIFGNPHVQLSFDVKDPDGGVEKWEAEGPGPARLAKRGWSQEMLKPGDMVTIVGNRAKNGSHTMRIDSITLADGQEMTAYARR